MSVEGDSDASLGNTLPTTDSQISHSVQLDYWTSQTADVNGMLGGYPQVSRIDLQGSKNFISKIRRLSRITSASTLSTTKVTKVPRAVDVGAGIGRITSGLLLNIAETVDIVEPVSKFTEVLAQIQPSEGQGQVGEIFNVGLEKWSPQNEAKYDLIWIQWCVGHLTDKQMVETLQRMLPALATYDDGTSIDGWIMVKENLSTDQWGEDLFDDIDSSVTRSDQKFKQLFEEAGCKIIKMEVQSGFPKSLYPVKMYALRPA